MILELVEFNSPKGWNRQQVAEEARHVIHDHEHVLVDLGIDRPGRIEFVHGREATADPNNKQ